VVDFTKSGEALHSITNSVETFLKETFKTETFKKETKED